MFVCTMFFHVLFIKKKKKLKEFKQSDRILYKLHVTKILKKRSYDQHTNTSK